MIRKFRLVDEAMETDGIEVDLEERTITVVSGGDVYTMEEARAMGELLLLGARSVEMDIPVVE